MGGDGLGGFKSEVLGEGLSEGGPVHILEVSFLCWCLSLWRYVEDGVNRKMVGTWYMIVEGCVT